MDVVQRECSHHGRDGLQTPQSPADTGVSSVDPRQWLVDDERSSGYSSRRRAAVQRVWLQSLCRRLEFHHLEPSEKSFSLSHRGVARRWTRRERRRASACCSAQLPCRGRGWIRRAAVGILLAYNAVSYRLRVARSGVAQFGRCARLLIERLWVRVPPPELFRRDPVVRWAMPSSSARDSGQRGWTSDRPDRLAPQPGAPQGGGRVRRRGACCPAARSSARARIRSSKAVDRQTRRPGRMKRRGRRTPAPAQSARAAFSFMSRMRARDDRATACKRATSVPWPAWQTTTSHAGIVRAIRDPLDDPRVAARAAGRDGRRRFQVPSTLTGASARPRSAACSSR